MAPVSRIRANGADAVNGKVVYDYPKMLWNLSMVLSAITLAPLTFNFAALSLFIVSTYFFLLIGHSAGMHRLMIHQTYDCHPMVEKVLIYIGVLVGMAGPYGVIHIHDLRDWAQRQPRCHEFFSHKRRFWCDLWWQLTSKFEFENAPQIEIETKYRDDPYYQWLESSWQ